MTFSYKRYLSLDPPSRDDFRADKERILDALKPIDASMPLSVMRTLYPLVTNSGYQVTVTLCPGRKGLEVTRVEPGDTTGSLYGLALDIGSTTLEMELVDMLSGKAVAHSGCVNSQVRFGLNILDRILAVKEDRNNLEQLRCLCGEQIGIHFLTEPFIQDSCPTQHKNKYQSKNHDSLLFVHKPSSAKQAD